MDSMDFKPPFTVTARNCRIYQHQAYFSSFLVYRNTSGRLFVRNLPASTPNDVTWRAKDTPGGPFRMIVEEHNVRGGVPDDLTRAAWECAFGFMLEEAAVGR